VNGYTQPFWQHARSSGYTHYTLQVLKHSDNCLRVHTTQHCGTHRCVSTQRCDSGAAEREWTWANSGASLHTRELGLHLCDVTLPSYADASSSRWLKLRQLVTRKVSKL